MSIVDSKSIDIVYSPELIRLQQFTNHLIDSVCVCVCFSRSLSPISCLCPSLCQLHMSIQWESTDFNTYVNAF